MLLNLIFISSLYETIIAIRYQSYLKEITKDV